MDDKGEPTLVLRVRRFSGFHRVGFSLFAVVLWGEREHATPAQGTLSFPSGSTLPLATGVEETTT